MLALSITRDRIKQAFVLDRFVLSAVAEKLSRVVSDVSDLTDSRIEGAILAHKRHNSTDYEKQLQAVGAHYYDGSHKDIQQATNDALRARIQRI